MLINCITLFYFMKLINEKLKTFRESKNTSVSAALNCCAANDIE